MDVQETGNGEMGMSGISLGTKNKYKRMDSELTDDHDFDLSQHHHKTEDRGSSTRKYVLACAVFASLNNVLLGYGTHNCFCFSLIYWLSRLFSLFAICFRLFFLF